MIFMLLQLWFLGVGVALLHFFVIQPLIRRLPWRPVQLLASTTSLVALWFLTALLTLIMVTGMGYQYSNTHAGTSGAAYCFTVIALFFDGLWRRRPQPRRKAATAAVDRAAHVKWSGITAGRDNSRETERPPIHKNSQERMRRPSLALLFSALILLLGIGIGLLIAHSGTFNSKKYTSFEECFLAESEGRQQATFPVVRKLCQDRLLAQQQTQRRSFNIYEYFDLTQQQSPNVFDQFDPPKDGFWKNDPVVTPQEKSLTDEETLRVPPPPPSNGAIQKPVKPGMFDDLIPSEKMQGEATKDKSALPPGFVLDYTPVEDPYVLRQLEGDAPGPGQQK